MTSILELAREAGKSAALVSASALVDASLAGFGAHVADRDDALEIARQLVQETRPDVMLGGGEDYFYPDGAAGVFPVDPAPEAKSMSVGTANLAAEAEAAGRQIVSDAEGLAAATAAPVLGLFANESLAFQPDPSGEGLEYAPIVPLADLTAKAIELLSRNPQGFVLVVEEDGGLDTVAHDNLGEIVPQGIAALDAAVGVAVDYAARDGETLVIVTADRETGGLPIEAEDDPEEPAESGVAADESPSRSGEEGPFPVAATTAASSWIGAQATTPAFPCR